MSDARETAIWSFTGITHISEKIPRCCKHIRKVKYSFLNDKDGKVNLSLMGVAQAFIDDTLTTGLLPMPFCSCQDVLQCALC